MTPVIDLPLILEADELQRHLGDKRLRIVDLSKAETHGQAHIPGAVFLDYPQIVAVRKPVMGLLPDDEHLTRILAGIGVTPETHVVAYDNEGGGKACRLLWTLEAIGHTRYSLLDGGLHAWANEGHPLTSDPSPVASDEYRIVPGARDAVADRDYILEHLGDPSVALLDTRSPEEFDGTKRFAARGGHIPGARNMDWTLAMDQGRNLRLKPQAELRALLEERGVTPDKTVVVYCQSHHRSAHTYVMLRSLGYTRVKGYAGSWSDWGNREDTPVE